MGKIEIGKISAAFGIKGELKLLHYSGEFDRIRSIEELFLVLGEKETNYSVASVRNTSKGPIIKLTGVEDRNAAELLAGSIVFVEESNLSPLDEDSYFINDIIGLNVIQVNDSSCNMENDGCEKIGVVTDFIDNSSNPIIQVKAEDGGKDFLLPFVDAFVKKIDCEKKNIHVEIPEGIRDLHRMVREKD